MRNLTAGISVMLLVLLSAAAQGQTTTAFDGTYIGVSRTVEAGGMTRGSTRGCALPNGVPTMLVIAKGVARTASDNPLEGSVNAQGGLIMRSRNGGGHFEGQIDARGQATGRLILSCSYQYVWQKQGR